MYQIVPLLLAFAMLMPWTGPADPGNRIAAANAANGLAEEALIYHQAAIAYVLANPGANGAIVPSGLPPGWSMTGIASCARSQIVATYVAVPAAISGSAVSAAMGRLWGGYAIAGQATSNTIMNPYTGLLLSIPCAVPDQMPALVSQAGG